MTITISPVLYAPECDLPLLFVDALNKRGFHVAFAPTYAGIRGIFMSCLLQHWIFSKFNDDDPISENSYYVGFSPLLIVTDSPPPWPFTHALKLQRPDISTQALNSGTCFSQCCLWDIANFQTHSEIATFIPPSFLSIMCTIKDAIAH